MKKNIFLIILICFISCAEKKQKLNEHVNILSECLNVNDIKLLKEGVGLFEEMLFEFYPNNNIDLSYELYIRDLMIGSDKLEYLNKDKRTTAFLKKLLEDDKLSIFWQVNSFQNTNNNFKDSISKIYYINKQDYLKCLQKTSKSEKFKTVFETLKTADEVSYAIAAQSLLVPQNKKAIVKDKEMFKILVAFHIFYEMRLNLYILNE